MFDLLTTLKRLDTDRLSMDEAMSLAAFARHLRVEYDSRSVTAPEWLDDAIRTLNNHIEAQRRDALELRLKEIAREESGLQTKEERRAALAVEKERIQQRLGGGGNSGAGTATPVGTVS